MILFKKSTKADSVSISTLPICANLQPGEKVRYKEFYSGHAVFVILRNGKQEQAEAFQPGEKEKIITNKFLNTVKVYLFYNSKEKWVEDDGSIKDGFVNNGADGSRMVFFMEIIQD